MPRFICVACGTQFPDAAQPPAACPICEDPRQYVPPAGQRWTTLEELRLEHRNEVRAEHELVGVGTSPRFAIGQRALLVPHGDAVVLWDCVSLLDDATAEEVERRGGLSAIAISHPHYYSSMVEWAHRFACPVLLHADDREWVMRPDPRWSCGRAPRGSWATASRSSGRAATSRAPPCCTGPWATGPSSPATSSRSSRTARTWRSCGAIPTSCRFRRRRSAPGRVRGGPRLRGDPRRLVGTVIPAGAKEVVRRSVERYGRALRGEL
jgi:hypothetical protein